LCKLLSITPLTQAGPSRILIWDIHELQQRFYFGDNIIPILSKSAPVLLKEIQTNPLFPTNKKELTIVFPDEGAYKRFANDYKDFNTAICSRYFTQEQRMTVLSNGNSQVKGSHCLIVDDTVNTGLSLMACKSSLLEAGATSVSCFVTHAIFTEDPNSWEQFINEKEETRFKIFLTTNSNPTVVEKLTKSGSNLFKVLSLGEEIYRSIESLLNMDDTNSI